MRALQRAETTLSGWVLQKIEEAATQESHAIARHHLQFMLDNVRIAEEVGLPLCQDTGLAIFHVQMGRDLILDFRLAEAVAEGVRIATGSAAPQRRPSPDPQEQRGQHRPRMPDIILDYVDGRGLMLTAFPKGAGSENMSLVGMVNPADDPFDFIVRSVAERAANACPPLFLGIGLGGSFDLAARLAKRALLNLPGSSQEELALMKRINTLA